MTTALDYDDETSGRIEAIYTTDDIVAQRRAVLEAADLQPAERVLDLGVGPGLLAAEMARVVGRNGLVCGVDNSDSMLAIAARRTQDVGDAEVELHRADARSVPHDDGSFDAAVSTQVLEYLDDVEVALAELHRVLRPGGRVVIVDTDWDTIVLRSLDRALTSRVLAAWEAHCADSHLPTRLPGLLTDAGFVDVRVHVVPLLNVGFAPATYSAGMLDLIADFVTGRDGLTAEDVKGWADGLRSLGPDYFFCLNRFLVTASRAS